MGDVAQGNPGYCFDAFFNVIAFPFVAAAIFTKIGLFSSFSVGWIAIIVIVILVRVVILDNGLARTSQ